MSTEDEEEKTAFEKEIKELVKRVFEKAKKDSRETSKTGWSKHIETEINSQINHRTLVRYCNQFTLEIDEGIKPNRSSLDIISKYLGFDDFLDFCREIFPDEDLVLEKNEEKKNELVIERLPIASKNKFRKMIVGIGVTSVLGLGSYFGLSANNSHQCMYWEGSSYERIDCSEILHPNVQIIPIDEKLLEYLHRIEVSDTTTFFKAGRPVVWYLKVDGVIEFYSADGKHPINGKDLRPITPYILDRYVLNK